jgi:hypothetical protein
MKQDPFISQLFEPEPTQWSLRGDPHLWQSLKEFFALQAMPSAEAELRIQFEQAFAKLTGHNLDTQETFFVDSFAHGGMSSGMIDPQYWNKSVWPLLVERFKLAQLIQTD